MKRKAYTVFAVLIFMAGLAVYSIATVSGGAEYVAAAEGQAIYQLDIAKARGTIYDCSLQPLVGTEKKWTAAVAPTIEAIGALEKATDGEYRERLAAALEDGKPFVISLDEEVNDACIDMFSLPQRYSENQLAAHIIGYLDGMDTGVCGIELAMNDALEQHSGLATVYYQVDALGRVVAGGEHRVVNTLKKSRGGIAITIDADIQALVEKASAAIEKGAVVVTEVPNCKIRALASFPGYSPLDLQSAADSEDGALLNRAFCAYAPGSVFKLVSAAARLETTKADEMYTCTGSVNADGLLFHCINGKAHGKLSLKTALEKSCNCYFINCAQSLGGQSILSMAYNLGLGVEQEFGRGLFTDSGNLPTAETLENPRALANFAFGQGELTVTPVQMCGMINAIASGGMYSSPKLIEGTVNEQLRLTPVQSIADKTTRAMAASTALTLQNYMKSIVTDGTAQSAAPTNCTVGIKTGTAQTGAYQGTDELLHFWYCGFVCDEIGPRYCISVLSESVTEDNGITAQVFRETAEGLGEIMQKQKEP